MIKLFQRFSHQTEEILLEAQNIANQNQQPLLSDSLVFAFLLREKTFVFELLKQAGLKKDIIDLKLVETACRPKNENEDELMVILQEAAKKAYQQKSSFIEPEHLFLSLIEKPNFLGTGILLTSGVNLAQVEYQLNEFLSGIAELTTVNQEILGVEGSARQNQDLLIDSFSQDLTYLAQKGKLDPISGRDREISQICQILCRRIKNNPLIIGEPGVGKTALVEGLAQAIVNRNVPKKLISCRILTLDLGQLVAGTNFRGQFEDRLTAIIDEVVAVGNIILFIDEVHTALGAGNIEGSLDVAQILKPALAGGELSVIGATTFDEYRKYIEKDRALARRFSTLTLSEPSKQTTALILKRLKKSFESHYQVNISDSFINLAVDLADRYLPERYFPDKAIDLLDEAAASTLPIYHEDQQIGLLKDKIKAISQQKICAIDQNNFQLAKSLKDEEDKLHQKFLAFEKNSLKKQKRLALNKQNIIRILEQKTNLPINLLQKTQARDSQIQANPAQIIRKTIFGQKKAIEKISRLLKMIDLEKLNRKPLFSAVFIGPSGVGKTETAKIIAEKILGSKDKLIKFDMSEFSERHTASSLIGAPAGYIGFEEGGRLTNAVKKLPFSVILFDEIEKAHSDIYNLFLQLLEDGFLTDNLGRKVNFNSTIIIFTSNLGNDILNQRSSIGFQNEKIKSVKNGQTLDSFYKKELKEIFNQELLARIDDIIVFDPLNEKAVKKIIKLRLIEIEKKLHHRGISLAANQSKLIQKIADDFDSKEGARGVAKFINHQLWSKILDLIDKKPQASIVEITANKKIDINIR